MQDQKNIIDCYNKTAKKYGEKFAGELTHKYLDRLLLNAFAIENKAVKIIDLGCGPGQTTQYLQNAGAAHILGTDISPEMIAVAKTIHPQINFETADILNLHYADQSFGAAVAFYAIVHFDNDQLKTAFEEINRILSNNGQLLFSFHTGDKIVHLDEFLEQQVNIDFNFFDTEKMIKLLTEAGFERMDVVERYPYPAIEYPSKRAYILAKKHK